MMHSYKVIVVAQGSHVFKMRLFASSFREATRLAQAEYPEAKVFSVARGM